jgi:AmmeMemoRadiSam system protein A
VLSADERDELLRIARQALECRARGGAAAATPPRSPVLSAEGAAFVTLRAGGELRGCIGYLERNRPLWRQVQEAAVAAASKDVRFDPLKPDELPELQIEITVLDPMRRIAGPHEIVIGRDGLVVRAGTVRGVLLPQVAAEHGWNAGTFLEQTCLKAGLESDAWKQGAELLAFSAEVISSTP